MKYKYDSMGRFIDKEFVFKFVEEFLPTLITYKGFLVEETIDELTKEGLIEEKKITTPLTHRGSLFDDEIELTAINGYPFIEQYFFDKLSDFFAPTVYDKYSMTTSFKYLNDNELFVLKSIGATLTPDMDSYDPNIKHNLDGVKNLYNPFYSEHTKEQVTFLLDNMASLLYMIDLIIKDIDKHKITIIKYIYDYYAIEKTDDINMNNLLDLTKSLKEYNPMAFKLPAIKFTDIETLYDKIKNNISSNYKNSKVLWDEEYFDHLIKYKILEIQQTMLYAKSDMVKDHHTFCKKLELFKTREVFAKRFSEILVQKNIDTNTVVAWLGVKPQTISDYKKSKTLPDNTNLIILSKNLNVSIDYLLGLSNIKDHKYYSAIDSFKKFGFTPASFDTLYYLKKDNPWHYAHLITTLNLLLEQEGLLTIDDITNYLTHRLSDDYYTINEKTVQELEDEIINLLNYKRDKTLIKQTLSNFRNKLPLSHIDNLDSTTLLSIQQDLIALKNHTVKNVNLMEEQIMPYFEKIWLNDNTDEDEDDSENHVENYMSADLEEENLFNNYIEENEEEDDTTSKDIPF